MAEFRNATNEQVCPCCVLCIKIIFAECGHGLSTNAVYVCTDRKSGHWANSVAESKNYKARALFTKP